MCIYIYFSYKVTEIQRSHQSSTNKYDRASSIFPSGHFFKLDHTKICMSYALHINPLKDFYNV